MILIICAQSRSKMIRTFGRYLSTTTAETPSSKNYVGFIGLGHMGTNMARNLIKKGTCLVVNDINPETTIELQKAGAMIAETPAAVAEKADRIISMLPSSPNVLEVYTGENGILSKIRQGTLLIDSSTIDPSVSRAVALQAEKRGAIFMDAPVSGGVMAAKEGSLTFMVGGRESEFQAAKELLSLMGTNIVHCGGVGTGEAAKICNNMLLAISMIGTAEAMNLGMKLGLEAKLLANILNTSSGRCWSSEVYNPVPGVMENVPAANNYQGGFGNKLMLKDLGLAQVAASRSLSSTPLGALAHQIYSLMAQKGFASKDFSSVFQFLQDTSNERHK